MACLQAPESQKLFFVGDIHGNYEALKKSLEQIHFDYSSDLLICTGDLVDRGPDSSRCLSLLQEPWFYTVVGNHDLYAFDTIINNSTDHLLPWMKNGGEWWFQQSEDQKKSLIPLLERFHRNPSPLLLMIEHQGIGNFAVTHADLPCSVDIHNLSCQLQLAGSGKPDEWVKQLSLHVDLLQGRWLTGPILQRLHKIVLNERQQRIPEAMESLYISSDEVKVNGVDAALQGHTPIPGGPLFAENRVFMDTGNWMDQRIFQISSSDHILDMVRL